MNRGKKQGKGRPPARKITKFALAKAIEIVGGVSNLALEIKVAQSRISAWLYTDERIPAEHVHKIVIATEGKVRPEELRPDVFVKMPDPKR